MPTTFPMQVPAMLDEALPIEGHFQEPEQRNHGHIADVQATDANVGNGTSSPGSRLKLVSIEVGIDVANCSAQLPLLRTGWLQT